MMDDKQNKLDGPQVLHKLEQILNIIERISDDLNQIFASPNSSKFSFASSEYYIIINSIMYNSCVINVLFYR